MPSIPWKVLAYEDLNALVLRLARSPCSWKAKDDLKARQAMGMWAVSQPTTPSEIA